MKIKANFLVRERDNADVRKLVDVTHKAFILFVIHFVSSPLLYFIRHLY